MRFRRIFLTVAVIGVGVASLAVPGPASADRTTFCSGVATDTKVRGDLVVPAGDSCELTDVTIDGDAIVRGGASLLLTDVRIDDQLIVQTDAFVDAIDTTVEDETRLSRAWGMFAEGSTLEDEVDADDSGFFYSVDSTHDGDVTSRNGETYLESSWLNRDLSTREDFFTDFVDTVIEGDVEVANAETGAVVCASEVDGDAAYTGNAGDAELFRIGASTPSDACGPNVFGDDLKLTGNRAAVQVSGNIIRGNLFCSENDSAPVGMDNRVRGLQLSQCASMAPESAAKMGAQSAADRHQQTLDNITARKAAAEQAARDAGPTLGGS